MGRERTGPDRRVEIGTSGYAYPHWQGRFYPSDLPARDRLRFYASHFDTVELNTTFYRLPTENAVRGWASQAPPGFLFAVKGSRFITHVKRLKQAGASIERFFSAIAPLGRSTGPILWQLPPTMKRDVPRLCDFVEALPPGLDHVVELRREDWYVDEVFEALADLDVALCLHDRLDAEAPWPPPGPLYYRRFHGRTARYAGRYGRSGLYAAASEIAALARAGTRCFAYFNNDVDAAAVADARALRQLVAEAMQAGRGAAWLER